MKRISAATTIISKRIFPVVWALVLVAVLVGGVIDGKHRSDPLFFLPPVAVLVFGLFLWRGLAADLADEVLDMGDYLIVRKGQTTEKVLLANVMNVDSSFNVNPPRITLHLVNPCRLGRLVSFSPKSGPSLNPFAKNPLIEELVLRAHAARAKSSA